MLKDESSFLWGRHISKNQKLRLRFCAAFTYCKQSRRAQRIAFLSHLDPHGNQSRAPGKVGVGCLDFEISLWILRALVLLIRCWIDESKIKIGFPRSQCWSLVKKSLFYPVICRRRRRRCRLISVCIPILFGAQAFYFFLPKDTKKKMATLLGTLIQWTNFWFSECVDLRSAG